MLMSELRYQFYVMHKILPSVASFHYLASNRNIGTISHLSSVHLNHKQKTFVSLSHREQLVILIGLLFKSQTHPFVPK